MPVLKVEAPRTEGQRLTDQVARISEWSNRLTEQLRYILGRYAETAKTDELTKAVEDLAAEAQAADGEIRNLKDRVFGEIVTDSNTASGLKAELYYHPADPNVMCLKIRGTTSEELTTSAGYAVLWDAGDFLTEAVGGGRAAIIKYVWTTNYIAQLQIEAGGTVKIGYTRRLSDGAAVNIPSSTNIYIEETVFMKKAT